MKKTLSVFLSVGILLLLLVGVASAKITVPPAPTQNIFVQDYADMFSPETEQYIQKTANNLRTKTKAEVVVVSIQSLEGNDIKDYTNELFNAWKPGDKKLNNGIIILVAKAEHKVRFEVGYGLEGAINDAKAGDIIRNAIIPSFKQNKYDEGIKAGFNGIVAEVANEYKTQVAGAKPVESSKEKSLPIGTIALVVVGVIVLCLIIGIIGGDPFLIFWLLFNIGGSVISGDGFGGGDSGGGGSDGGW